jgi:cytosine/adenosine deaminase-related metal-dependent hydrolase
MLDLLVRRATLPDGRRNMDIACRDGRIVEVSENIDAPGAALEIDAGDCLVTPPFVDSHFHLDSTLSYGRPRVNQSGTLLEGIALWGEFGRSAIGPSPGATWPSAATWTSRTRSSSRCGPYWNCATS